MREEFKEFQGKTVLVTGATGFTGQVLTRKLVEAGANVRAIARQKSDLGELAGLDIEWFRGEVFDEDIVAQATPGVNYIFHLAAAFRETHPDEEGYRRVHLYSTQLLAKAALEQPDFRCFLHVSTVGVHGHIEDGMADENYRFSPGDPYQRTKLEGELWITEFARENNLPFSVIRPGPIFGPGDMRLLKLFRMVSKGFFMKLGKTEGWYQVIHVEDLTNLIMLAAVRPEARSEVIIAAGDQPMLISDMVKLIAEKIGRRVRIVQLPVWPFYIAADVCCAICRPFGISPPLYRRRVDFFTKDRRFDISKAKRLLDYEYLYDNDRGIEETANWYLNKKLIS